MRRSSDGGHTWSEIVDVTSQLWGSQATNTVCSNYRATFFSSGNGLRLRRGEHAGRIMFAVPMLRNRENISDNFVVFSDDNGLTWQVSYRAYNGGDEAKLMELVDGRILLSTRQNGARGHNTSSDGGMRWEQQGRWDEMTTNACNGDMLRLDDTTIIHSIVNSPQRQNVSIFTSNDEGVSWHTPVSLFEGPSVYSSLTMLDDGTIGAYVELNPNGPCELWYMNFNRKWLEERTDQMR